MKHLQETLQELAALPNDRPMGMPGAFYTSQEYYEHETRTVLRSGWHCLGREDEIPNTGDYFTAQLLNEPLLVVRADDGTIAQRIALWSEVNREDREKLEKMQVALASAHATSGPLAEDDYERTIRDFQVWLARRNAELASI
jgi:phenylpropionate dioxygenase-like ring-hydroxylating dioxygenase large terminal subunit